MSLSERDPEQGSGLMARGDVLRTGLDQPGTQPELPWGSREAEKKSTQGEEVGGVTPQASPAGSSPPSQGYVVQPSPFLAWITAKTPDSHGCHRLLAQLSSI